MKQDHLRQRKEEFLCELPGLRLFHEQRMAQIQRDRRSHQRDFEKHEHPQVAQILERDNRLMQSHVGIAEQIGVKDHRRCDAKDEQAGKRRRVGADHPQGQVEQIDKAAFADHDAVLVELHGKGTGVRG